MHALVPSRLYHCNARYVGLPLGDGTEGAISSKCGSVDIDGSQEVPADHPHFVAVILAPKSFPCPNQSTVFDLLSPERLGTRAFEGWSSATHTCLFIVST